jgi:hypothetical protein
MPKAACQLREKKSRITARVNCKFQSLAAAYIRSFFATRRKSFKKNSPEEEQHLQVPRVFLERTVQSLNEYVQGCTAELVFNLDEVGILDWENRKARKVVVPATMPAMRGQTRHDTARNISKAETYLGDCFCFRCCRIAHRFHYYIARFSLGPKAAQEASCSVRNEFDHEVEFKAFHQCRNLF